MGINERLANAKEVDFFAELSDEEKMQADLLAEISIKIHECRMALGMTQEEFAKFNSVTQTMVSKWESGDYNFSIQTLVKLFMRMGQRVSFDISKLEKEEATAIVKEKINSKETEWKCETTTSSRWSNHTASRVVYLTTLGL